MIITVSAALIATGSWLAWQAQLRPDWNETLERLAGGLLIAGLVMVGAGLQISV